MKKSIFLLFLFFLLSNFNANAQWNCPSKLGSVIQPISPMIPGLKIGAELTGSTGYLADNYYGFYAAYLGIDYTRGVHNIYLEGGAKGFSRWDNNNSQNFNNRFAGFREAFYQLRLPNTLLRAGVQTTTLGDDYLVNERMLGLKFEQRFKQLELQAASGTVMKYFARNGLFCNVGYVYDILYRDRGFIGSKLGETNFAGATLSIKTSKESKLKAKFGLSIYDEFYINRSDTSFNKNVLLVGAFGNMNVLGVDLNANCQYQTLQNENAYILSLSAKKMINWDFGHRTELYARAIGVLEMDKAAIIRNSFSNLFLGDVVRLDARDAPLYQASIRHSLPKYSLHFKAQYTSEFEKTGLNEFDFSISKRFNNVYLSGIFGYLNYNENTLTSNDVSYRWDNVRKQSYLARLECRITIAPPKINKNQKNIE